MHGYYTHYTVQCTAYTNECRRGLAAGYRPPTARVCSTRLLNGRIYRLAQTFTVPGRVANNRLGSIIRIRSFLIVTDFLKSMPACTIRLNESVKGRDKMCSQILYTPIEAP